MADKRLSISTRHACICIYKFFVTNRMQTMACRLKTRKLNGIFASMAFYRSTVRNSDDDETQKKNVNKEKINYIARVR